MTTTNHNLIRLFDLPKFQKLQDSLSIVSQLAIITVDYKGIPLTNHSQRSQFCSKMRMTEQTNSLCERCDSRGGLEAIRLQKPFIYLCHANIIDIAIPIVHEDKYLGAILAGQVIVEPEKDFSMPEKITSFDSYNKYIKGTELEILYNQLPKMELSKIQKSAELINDICSYIIDSAIAKENSDSLNSFFRSMPNQIDENFQKKSDYYNNNFKIPKQKNTKLKSRKFDLLQPAIQYIEKNRQEKLSINDMAALCNISSSYFSKLFNSEYNIRFNTYISQQKLTYSKELLEKTSMSISEISSFLNYEDCGYFIKLFKTQYGTTPAKYRKYIV